MKNRDIIGMAALFGCLAVVMGAFGAHGLKPKLSAEAFAIFEKGVQYQFYHVFGILGVGVLSQWGGSRYFRWAGVLFGLGILFFSGSLYLLACRDLLALGAFGGVLGPITPLGGVCFIGGWVCLWLGIREDQ